MDNSEFVTYRIKLFPSPKNQSYHYFESDVQNQGQKPRKLLQDSSMRFKSRKKLKEYRLIRFSAKFLRDVFIVKLCWRLWRQFTEDLVEPDGFGKSVLRTADFTLYKFLQASDLGILFIAFPLLSYWDRSVYRIREFIESPTTINIWEMLSVGCLWFDQTILKYTDFIFLPIVHWKRDRLKNTLSLVNEQHALDKFSKSSGFIQLIQLILIFKYLTIRYLLTTVINICIKPAQYIAHINGLLNRQLQLYDHISPITLLKMLSNVFVQILEEFEGHFKSS